MKITETVTFKIVIHSVVAIVSNLTTVENRTEWKLSSVT